MDSRMDRTTRIWLIFGILILVAVLAAYWANSTFPPSRFLFVPRFRPPNEIPGDYEFYYTAQTVLSTINVTLSVFLLLTYMEIYQKTKSEFTIGLIIFSAVILLNALSSNPFVIRFFGFEPVGLGPFALLPQIFATGALLVLLYLSIRY